MASAPPPPKLGRNSASRPSRPTALGLLSGGHGRPVTSTWSVFGDRGSEQQLDVTIDRGIDRERRGPAAQQCSIGRRFERGVDRSGHGVDVGDRHELAIAAAVQDLHRAMRAVGADHRAAAGERLDQHARQALATRRQDEGRGPGHVRERIADEAG
jgi:hypothetical protein